MGKDSGMGDEQTNRPFRMWALHVPFKKDGFPSMGSFGTTIDAVIVMKMDTWTKLCAKYPDLGAEQFEVGSYD